MEDTKLIAEKRDQYGSSNSRRLRRAGSLPCVIYGEGKEALHAQLNTHAFEQMLHHHASETIITDIELQGSGDVQVLVKDVQRNYITGQPIHVDLQKIIAGQAIQVDIMLEIVGEAVGVKNGGLLELQMHSIEIECLPKDLVESIEVDVSALKIGDAITVADLKLTSAFTPLIDGDMIVVAVAEPRLEEEEDDAEDADAVASEPEVLTEKKSEEDAG